MILHVDMDAFYAAVEQRDNAELRGKPVVVGGAAAGRGVVSAASYEARQFGIHSAMPAVTARRLCPHAVFLPVRMEHYAAISSDIRQIFGRYTPLVEPLSLDEAFLDVTGSQRLFGTAIEIGQRIKQEILAELRLIASVGVASNKFLAKLASDLQKPDGFVVVDPDQIQAFLDPLPVGGLWGVGRTTGKVFERLGVRTVADLRKLSVEVLQSQFGQHGEHLWRLARGLDDRRVIPDMQAKSISHETTFAVDVDNVEVCEGWILELAEQVGRRLRRQRLLGTTAQLKVRSHDFKTLTRSRKLMNPTNLTQEIYEAALELFRSKVPAASFPVRLLGVGLSGFDGHGVRQQMLFDESRHEQHQQLDTTSDLIRDKFGRHSLARGSALLRTTLPDTDQAHHKK